MQHASLGCGGRVLEGDECNVFDTVLDVGVPGATDTARPGIEKEPHDADVMRGEVPDDVDVLPDLPEVEAPRVEVVDIAEGSGVELLLGPPEGIVVDEGVPGHQGESAIMGDTREFEALGAGCGERFLDEDVLAGQQCLAGEGVVRLGGGGDDDGVDARRIEEGGPGIVECDGGIPCADVVQPGGVGVGDGCEG